MYLLASILKDLPVISLQTGERVASVVDPIFDPSNLSLSALRCVGLKRHSTRILMMRDARQVAGDCVVIDSEDELADPEDIVRIQALIADPFVIVGKRVVTDTGRHLGSVEDYTINIETYRLQKLYVKQSILRSFLGSSLIIDRAQIIDVTSHQIVIRDSTVKAALLPNEPVPESHP